MYMCFLAPGMAIGSDVVFGERSYRYRPEEGVRFVFVDGRGKAMALFLSCFVRVGGGMWNWMKCLLGLREQGMCSRFVWNL